MSSGKRGRNKDPYTLQVIDALKDEYPKFTKVQMSLIRNPAYGLQLASDAEAMLKAKGIPSPNKQRREKRTASFKSNPKRTRPERLTVRLTSDEKVLILEHAKASGCISVQEYILKLVKENEHGKEEPSCS